MNTPIARGSVIAIAAAVLFGATAPFVKYFGRDVGPFATAALLYGGATIASGLPRPREREAAVRSSHAVRILLVALFGAAIAPACLAWGLQRAGALAASLLLNLEAVSTILLARVFYREPIGARVIVASSLMLAGGALLGVRSAGGDGADLLGVIAVMGSTLAWALDNTLTRPLADLDPQAVVFWKGLLGAAISVGAAVFTRDRWPPLAPVLALLACGACGYGLSLRLYLRAQRVLGAARTGSLFAFGPFVGAVIAFVFGDRFGGQLVAAASACFVCAVWLHATERHVHHHWHMRLEHEHSHRHDDAHHTHAHVPLVEETHSHQHTHEPMEHDHPHGADVHHRHGHD